MTQQEAEVTLRVNSAEARRKLEELETQAADLRRRFAEAFRNSDTRGVEATRKQLQQTNREIEAMRTNAANIRAAMKRLDQATPRELQRTIKLINNELNSGRVPRGTKQWESYTRMLRDAKEQLRQVNAELTATGQKAAKGGGIAEWTKKWWSAFDMAKWGLEKLGLGFDKMRSDALAQESSSANLKALTGLDDNSIAWLTAQAETLSTTMDETGLRVTQSARDILEAYMLVGSNKPELLSSKEALNAVTIEAMRLSTAAKMDLAPAVNAMTTALNQYGAGADEAARFVNVLAAGSKFGAAGVEAQAASILNAGTAAASAGVTFEELVGTIETLGEKGIKAEVAGTGLKKLFLTMQTGAADTNPKVVGLEKALANLSAAVAAAEAKSAGGGASFLKKMFGEEGYSIAAVLTSNTAKVREYTAAVTATNTATEQAAINSDTAQAKMEQMGNKATQAGIELYNTLAPALAQVAELSTSVLEAVVSVIKVLASCPGAIMGAAAAFTLYQVALTLVAAKAKLMIMLSKTWNGLIATKRSLVLLCSIAYNKLAGNATRAAAAQRAFALAQSATPWGAVITAVGLAAGALAEWYTKAKAAREEEARLREEHKAHIASLTDVEEASEKSAAAELLRAKALYKTATDENAARKDRLAAVRDLQRLYPKYLANVSAEEIMAGRAAANYAALAESIRDAARARAAEDKMVENEKAILNIEGRKEALNETADDAKWELYEERMKLKGLVDMRRTTRNRNALEEQIDAQLEVVKEAEKKWTEAQNAVKQIDDRISEYNRANEQLQRKYEISAEKVAERMKAAAEVPSPPPYTPQETDKERRKRERKAKEAEREADNALKKELDKAKANRDKLEAANIAQRSQGLKTQREYDRERRRIETDYADDVVAIHERHNQRDVVGYASALKAKQELAEKYAEADRKLSVEALDRRHREHTDGITADFHNPASSLFNNEEALRERLLKEDERYLREKAKRYAEGSKERADLENEADALLNDDKRRRQKELVEAYNSFAARYRDASGSEQEKLELDMLKRLLDAKLITEEEYAKAVNDLKDKNRNADRERRRAEGREIKSEYADMVETLHTSFTELFDSLGKDGADFWGNLSGAAEAAFAVMGAGLQSYSALANAERDIELARTEKRLDREIKAAGNNTKLKERLEARKEEEIARIKKKHNDKAMKVELAQAIAQTAVGAIAAYSAALKTGPAGLVLAPIAAALATAAGMAQVAVIKKQHEAQAEGYYSGGFTRRDPDNRRPAGVVHANEFVADHRAVANPGIAPVLRLIDHAQRNNTIASLTAADVSRAIGQGGAAIASPTTAATPPTAPELAGVAAAGIAMARAAERLSRRLDEPFVTVNTVTGDSGIKKAQTDYDRLIRNKNPKTRK